MAVYYKFKSAKDYNTIPIDGHFISVGNLKEKIFESKLGRGKDFDLLVTNAQTNEEYTDLSALVPKNTAVLIRRVPGMPRKAIVATQQTEEEPKPENKLEDDQTLKNSFVGLNSSAVKIPEDTEWDEFGNDLYSIPEALPVQSSNQYQDIPLPSKADEDSNMMAFIDTPALDWKCPPAEGFGAGKAFGRNGQMMNNRNFVRTGFERKTPPPGYICHRCKVPGHFIQHCSTNGDPNFDVKRVNPPTGIPKSMLMATPDGSYALPSGAAAVLRPNEAAFEKEIEGMPSTRSVGDVPPELRCPLCKEVMKDAVLTSKCCFSSFCDKCIRDNIISKSVCVCGATNVLADDLLPNKTLRETINRILESNTSSAENGGSTCQVQDMESRNPQAKVPSPTQSAASKGVRKPPAPSHREETSKMQELETASEVLNVDAPTQATEKEKAMKAEDAHEATNESISLKEPASQADKEVQQKPASDEAGKKKKKKKVCIPFNGVEMQCRMAPHLADENYTMSMGPNAYNPCWGMQPGIESSVNPYAGGMPYMSYGFGPMDVPFGGGFLPHDPFGGQGCMLPYAPPHRDLANFVGMGFNAGPPPMSREAFEARKADLKRQKEMERHSGERVFSKDREFGKEVSRSGDISSMKSKSKSILSSTLSSDHHCRHRQQSKRPSSPDHRSRDHELSHISSKRKSEYNEDHFRWGPRDAHHRHRDYNDSNHNVGSRQHQYSSGLVEPISCALASNKMQKSNGYSRIKYSEASKKRRRSPPNQTPKASTKYVDYEISEDEDRHFKRRPSRY